MRKPTQYSAVFWTSFNAWPCAARLRLPVDPVCILGCIGSECKVHHWVSCPRPEYVRWSWHFLARRVPSAGLQWRLARRVPSAGLQWCTLLAWMQDASGICKVSSCVGPHLSSRGIGSHSAMYSFSFGPASALSRVGPSLGLTLIFVSGIFYPSTNIERRFKWRGVKWCRKCPTRPSKRHGTFLLHVRGGTERPSGEHHPPWISRKRDF